jgi:hypothetical protein
VGAWIAGTLLTIWIHVNRNVVAAEAMVYGGTALNKASKVLGAGSVSNILRYQSVEQSRSILQDWEKVEFVAGVLLFGLFLFGTNVRYTMFLPLVGLLFVGAAHVVVWPGLVASERLTQIMPAAQALVEQGRVDALDRIYFGLQAGKLIALSALGVILVRATSLSKVRKRARAVEKPEQSGVKA